LGSGRLFVGADGPATAGWRSPGRLPGNVSPGRSPTPVSGPGGGIRITLAGLAGSATDDGPDVTVVGACAEPVVARVPGLRAGPGSGLPAGVSRGRGETCTEAGGLRAPSAEPGGAAARGGASWLAPTSPNAARALALSIASTTVAKPVAPPASATARAPRCLSMCSTRRGASSSTRPDAPAPPTECSLYAGERRSRQGHTGDSTLDESC
jgi:hypothetical protein